MSILLEIIIRNKGNVVFEVIQKFVKFVFQKILKEICICNKRRWVVEE